MKPPALTLPDDVRALLARRGEARVATVEAFVAAAPRPCVYLTSTRVAAQPLVRRGLRRLLGSIAAPKLPVMASKLGGAPYDEIDDRDWERFAFLGQIDLATLPALDGFPRRGVFALDVATEPVHRPFRLRWYPDAAPERARGPAKVPCVGSWEVRVDARLGWSLPGGDAWHAPLPDDDEVREAWDEWEPDGFGEDERDECHRWGGHRSAGLDEPYDFAPENGAPIEAYEQLLRITYDNAADFGWGTNWMYVLIHRDDLAAGRLDRALVTGANS